MYDKLPIELRAILEPRLDLSYFTKKDFCFDYLFFRQIDTLDFSQYDNKKTIIFLMTNDYDQLQDIDKLKKLLSRTLVFTNKNIFNLFGIPERYFYFNPLINERQFYLSNNGIRTINEEMYFIEKSYSGVDLNNIIKINIPDIIIDETNKDKLFVDILKFLCCGCSVYCQSDSILKMFDSDISLYFNLELSEKDKLNAQYEIHKKYSYIIQSDGIEKQLYGIFGYKHDLI